MSPEQKKARDALVRLVALAAYAAWKRGDVTPVAQSKIAGTKPLPYGISIPR